MVFGCYSAVALADPRALQEARQNLGEVLESRAWRKGAYDAEVGPL